MYVCMYVCKLRRDGQLGGSGDPLSTFAPYDSLSGCPQGKKRVREGRRERERAMYSHMYLAHCISPRIYICLALVSFLHSRFGETLSAGETVSSLPSGTLIARTRRRSRDQDRGLREREDSADEFGRDACFFRLAFSFLPDETYTRDGHTRDTTHDAVSRAASAAGHSGLNSRSLRTRIQADSCARSSPAADSTQCRSIRGRISCRTVLKISCDAVAPIVREGQPLSKSARLNHGGERGRDMDNTHAHIVSSIKKHACYTAVQTREFSTAQSSRKVQRPAYLCCACGCYNICMYMCLCMFGESHATISWICYFLD